MLNLSSSSVENDVLERTYASFDMLGHKHKGERLRFGMLAVFAVMLVLAFLPWTQNIQTEGRVTMRSALKRPQTVQSAIPGRISAWYVQEGDHVTAGDTLLTLTEVKAEYSDPALVERTREQVAAKTSSQQAYSDKAAALADQQHALREARDFKLASAENAIEQARLTVTSDSAKKVAVETDLNVAQRQMARYDTLFLRGLVSRTELEERLQAWQKAQAEFTAAANKLDISRRSLTNAALAQSTVASEFADKLAKAESERQTALSGEAEARGEVAKLRNQLANNEARTAFHVVRAPQSGRIAQALRSGVGETVKEGSDLLTIVPDDGDLAVEMYVSPMDLPLLQVGNEVRFLFDGWPSIVFAGWPEATYGTFPGEVVAIDQVISENGMYRVVVAPHSEQQPWPEALRAGGGARGIALLQRVPVWYEVWRQLNGFPPDFYAPDPAQSQPKGGQVSKKPQIKIS